MSAFHVIYGLQVAVNMALPGLPVQSHPETRDVQIHLKDGWPFPTTLPPLGENISSSDGVPDAHPNLRAGLFPGGGHFGFFYRDGARFAVDRCGREVWAFWPEDYTLEDACTYLLGPVMGFVLRLRGSICLHASSVAISDHAVALAGLPGAGKSTAAAAFACASFAVLSDDITVLAGKGGQCFVQPGYPRVNLWPDSVRRLFGSEEALPCISPTWEKRYLPLGQNGYRFGSNPLPLGAIYLLNGRDAALTAPVLEEVSGEEAFMALVANTYLNYLLDQDMRRAEFEVLGGVVSRIPIRRIRLPGEPAAPFDLCEAIAADAKLLMPRVQANAAFVPG